MVRLSSPGALLTRRSPALLIFSLYLLLGLALAAPASAEHLSQKRSHARRSLDHGASNTAKRAPAPQNIPVQQVRGSLLDLGVPGVGIVLGGDDGSLLNVTLLPSDTSTSTTTATSSESTSSAGPTANTDATTSPSQSTTSPGTTSPATSPGTTSPATSPGTTSPAASPATSPGTESPATSPATSSGTTSADTTSVSQSTAESTSDPASSSDETSSSTTSSVAPPVATTPADETPATSCAAGFQLLGLVDGNIGCVPVSSSTTSSSVSSSSLVPAATTESTPSTSTIASTLDSTDGPSPTTSEGNTITTSSSNSAPASADTTSQQCDGVVSVNVAGVSLCVPPVATTSSQPSEPTSDPVTATVSSPDATPSPSSEPGTTAEPSPSTSECTGLLCGVLPTTTAAETTTTGATDASTLTSSVSESEGTTCTGLLCGIVPTITSEDSTASESATTSSDVPTTSDASPPVTTGTETTCSGPLCSVLPPITTTAAAPGENTTSAEPPVTTTDTGTTVLPPITTTTASPGENVTTTSAPPDITTTVLQPGGNDTTTTTGGLNSTITTSVNGTETTITFPSGNTTTSDLITLTSTPIIQTSVASQFSFLTQSSLLFSEISTSTLPTLTTLTNPDEPTTTAELESAVTGATVSSVPLPSGLPARIYPADGGVTAGSLTDFTSVNILFNEELGWPFVATNTDSAAQIFAYFPPCLQVALGISSDQVKTFALQAYKTSEYRSQEDTNELRTLYIAYIPADNVTALEQAIKAKQSDLYTKTTGISAQLAQRIDVSYSITSGPNPISEEPNSSSGVNSSASSNNTRRDAIIGVCSALGGVAVCILGFLLYRNFKRRQEAAHQRLVEDRPFVGPAPGQDFDRDSIGGQRRRSFYFAEDSLRGFAQPGPRDEAYTQHVNPVGAGGGMRERRPIAPGAISAPILRDNTLNW